VHQLFELCHPCTQACLPALILKNLHSQCMSRAISPVTGQGQHNIIASDGESLVMALQNEWLRNVDYIVIYFSILE